MKYSLLFTGHMIDAKDRSASRFPAHKKKIAREEIRKYLLKEKQRLVKKKAEPADISAIASGACGGDIIFHELCEEMHIHTEMYLALPIPAFRKASVSFAGNYWTRHFDKLVGKLRVHILQEAKPAKEQNVWERTNTWMLDTALKNGGKNMTLLALWDRKGGDGEGGTAHMVKMAKKYKARTIIININKI